MDSRDPQDFTESTTSTITYSIPAFGLQQGTFIFSFVGFFLSLITPHDLPVELIRNAIYSNVTFEDLISEALIIEFGLISSMGILIIISIIPMGVSIAWCCKRKPPTPSSEEHIDPLMALDDTPESTLQCRRKASLVTIIIIFLLLLTSNLFMFVANSKLWSNANMAPDIMQASIKDVEAFLKDTHHQIKRSLDNGYDIAIRSLSDDLEDIDILLGGPIKTDISANTGIELAFGSLTSISNVNHEIITRILLLQESIEKSLKISQEAASRMEELQIQLSVLQRQCTFRDRPLCDTLRIRSFEENGIIDALRTLQEDQEIFKMRYLGELEIDNTVKNLTVELSIAKSIFGNFPTQVKKDTIPQRNETIEQLDMIKSKTTTMAQMLTQTIVSLLDQLTGTWEGLKPFFDSMIDVVGNFWGLAWSAAMMVLLVVIFMLVSLCCNCCGSKTKSAVFLITTVITVSVTSLFLMFFASVTLFIGGNGEIFICRPLFDDINYEFIEQMFDNPGLIYSEEREHGIIGDLLKPPGSNISIVNISIATALRDCEKGKPTYKVFQLDAFLNKTKMVDFKKYPRLSTSINNIRVSDKTLLSLTQTIQSILENMLHTADLNVTAYRSSISQPTPEKDLATFIDQMQRVALQIQDVSTSSRMTTLGSRAKRLQSAILQPLEQLRNEILYHLTALELQKDPWARQVNQTYQHLKNVQSYLEKTAHEICSNQTKVYIERLQSYLTTNRDKVSQTLDDTAATCRPLFDIFEANRTFICRYVLDMLNGLWFCTFLCLFLWSVGTPIALNLIIIHNKLNTASGLRHTNSHLYGTPSDTFLISEQSNWGVYSPAQRPREMSRQDSSRSVRWETTEVVFDNETDSIGENLV